MTHAEFLAERDRLLAERAQLLAPRRPAAPRSHAVASRDIPLGAPAPAFDVRGTIRVKRDRRVTVAHPEHSTSAARVFWTVVRAVNREE